MKSFLVTICLWVTSLRCLLVIGCTPPAPFGLDSYSNATEATNLAYFAILHEYIIWPKDGKDRALTDETTPLIQQLVLPNPVWPYVTLYDGLVWWMVNCSLGAAYTICLLPGVRRIFCIHASLS